MTLARVFKMAHLIDHCLAQGGEIRWRRGKLEMSNGIQNSKGIYYQRVIKRPLRRAMFAYPYHLPLSPGADRRLMAQKASVRPENSPPR